MTRENQDLVSKLHMNNHNKTLSPEPKNNLQNILHNIDDMIRIQQDADVTDECMDEYLDTTISEEEKEQIIKDIVDDRNGDGLMKLIARLR